MARQSSDVLTFPICGPPRSIPGPKLDASPKVEAVSCGKEER
jgi:hypothetical protein